MTSLPVDLEVAVQEIKTLRAENARLRSLIGLDRPTLQDTAVAWEPSLFTVTPPLPQIDMHASEDEKIALYRSLFIGRDDVYAVRWENRKTGRSGWSPAIRGGWTNAKHPKREYLPLTGAIVANHLKGRVTVGLYPLLADDTSRLLVCDFDSRSWALDALAYVQAANANGIPVALECSRSGRGAHVWTFFASAIPATWARRLGAIVLREAMAMRAEVDFASYDRLFPSQDFVPHGSFGNLIALPLQGECAALDTSVFLDPSNLAPWPDQWAFLSSVDRMSRQAVESAITQLRPVDVGPDAALRRRGDVRVPAKIHCESGAGIAIESMGLPPWLLATLKHLASVHNPEFHKKERLRLSTWQIPRMICCYDETLDRLILPRGLLEKARRIVREAGSTLVVDNVVDEAPSMSFVFNAVLSDAQNDAVDAMAKHDLGVLVAPPGAGKSVMGTALMARHATPTLVVVDREALLEQWRTQLGDLLGLDKKEIGQLGGGRRRLSGVVDLAMVQSLARRDDLADLSRNYGLVIADECHHVPAVTFQRAMKQLRVKRWVGLTATPYRADGLDGIIVMQCGPVRHRVSASTGNLQRKLILHETRYERVATRDEHIQTIFRDLIQDSIRLDMVCNDVSRAVDDGRRVLVLTQWTQHLEALRTGLQRHGLDPLMLRGGLSKRVRDETLVALRANDRNRPLIATGSYLGEGFDHPELDTLFLAFPMVYKGRLEQYIGRIMRATANKTDVHVHDYVDTSVPVLARMFVKRMPTFERLGFHVPDATTWKRKAVATQRT